MSYNKHNPRPITDNFFLLSNYSQKQRVSLSFPDDSPYTKQEFRDECDINTLMSRYQNTGEYPPLSIKLRLNTWMLLELNSRNPCNS